MSDVDVDQARAAIRETLALVQIASHEYGAAIATVVGDEVAAWEALGATVVPVLDCNVLAHAATFVGEPRLPELVAACDSTIAAAATERDALVDALLDEHEVQDISARRALVDARLTDARHRLLDFKRKNSAVIDAAARGQRLRIEHQAIVNQHAELGAVARTIEAEAARLSSLMTRHHRARRDLTNSDDERAAIGERFLNDARRVVIDRLRTSGHVASDDVAVVAHQHRIEAAVARRLVVDVLFESWVRPHIAILGELEVEGARVSGFETVSYPAKVKVRCTDANAALDAFRRIVSAAMTTGLPAVVDDWWLRLVPGVPRPDPSVFNNPTNAAIPGLTASPRAATVGISVADRASDKLAAAWASLNDGTDEPFAVDSGLFYGLNTPSSTNSGVLRRLPVAPPAPLPMSGASDALAFDEATVEHAAHTATDVFTINKPEAARHVDVVELTRPTFLPGTRVGRCVVQALIGKGGMGEDYRARLEGDFGFSRQVVVKRLSLESHEPGALQAFVREAGVAARIAHPNVVQIFDLQAHGGEPVMIMELLEGLSLHKLASRVRREGLRMDPRVLARCALDVARGLHAAHTMRRDDGGLVGLVHRDVSPDNLFLCHNGTTKLLDFGIARRNDLTTMTGKAELKGKIPYMSPEQIIGGHLDGRSDLFSLGASLYWLLCGERPFVGENEITTLYAVVNKAHLPLADRRSDIGPLSDVVEWLLKKDRDERPGSALQCVQRLESIDHATPEEAASWLTLIEQR